MRASLTPMLALAVSAWLPTMFPGIVIAQESGEKMETLETIRKRVYRDVEVLFTDPHGITFRHSKGTAKIPFEQLDESIRKKYNYSREAALQFLREHAVVKPAPAVRRIVVRPSPLRQFVPGTFTLFAGGTPVTLHGSTLAGAVSAAQYVPPGFVRPVPVCSPFSLYLWRQLQLGNHLTFSRTHGSHRVGGFDTVATRIGAPARYPVFAHGMAPAMVAGRGDCGVPAGSREGAADFMRSPGEGR